ncbi:MAG: LSU ribosomal protein L33p @ LSU ribosomal protein L33p, zinc-independent, partial [uncultured Thermomicrobiales bacterium]
GKGQEGRPDRRQAALDRERPLLHDREEQAERPGPARTDEVRPDDPAPRHVPRDPL